MDMIFFNTRAFCKKSGIKKVFFAMSLVDNKIHI